MVDAQSCAAEIGPLYAVIPWPELAGTLTVCMTIALCIVLWDSFAHDPGPPPLG